MMTSTLAILMGAAIVVVFTLAWLASEAMYRWYTARQIRRQWRDARMKDMQAAVVLAKWSDDDIRELKALLEATSKWPNQRKGDIPKDYDTKADHEELGFEEYLASTGVPSKENDDDD